MNKMPHIQLDAGIACSAAILPGDPARVDEIAKYLEDVKEEGFNREYKSVTGTYKGRRILAMSTGMGGASAAIGVEELADLGVRDMIRIGSCGALQSHLRLGQLVICDRAVCDDGASQSYMQCFRYAARDWPSKKAEEMDDVVYAPADPEVVKACHQAAQDQGFDCEIGSTRSHDALYLKEKPLFDELYSTKGVYASDMETAALFAAAKARGVRACSILNVVVEWKKDIKEGVGSYKDGADAASQGEKNEIIAALEALALLGKD